MIELVLAFLLALALSFLMCPLASRLSIMIGMVDHPDARRKLHKKPIPLIGGFVLVPTIALSVGIIYAIKPELFSQVKSEDWWQILGLLIATVILLGVGILDDRFGLRGRQKVLGQLVAILVLYIFEYRFEEISIFQTTLKLKVTALWNFSIIFIFAWMMGAINSINLLDGADGFAGTIGIILSLAFAVMSAFRGDTNLVDTIIAAGMAGALLGFLRLNFPPAKVFLGDSGSMVIGFILGALAIRLTYKEATVYAFLGPIAVLAIPFIDTIAAIIRRRLTGRSIYATDRGHLHHELQRKGISNRRMLFYVAILCVVTATGGVLSLVTKQSEYAVISIVAVIAFLLISRLFGFAEFRLLSGKIFSISNSFLVLNRGKKVQTNEVRIQGEANWQGIWNELRKFAALNQIARMTLDLNIPWLHESFHATLKNDLSDRAEKTWWTEIPIVVDKRIIGRLDILASNESEIPVYDVIKGLIDKIDSLAPEFRETFASVAESEKQRLAMESANAKKNSTDKDGDGNEELIADDQLASR